MKKTIRIITIVLAFVGPLLLGQLAPTFDASSHPQPAPVQTPESR